MISETRLLTWLDLEVKRLTANEEALKQRNELEFAVRLNVRARAYQRLADMIRNGAFKEVTHD